MKRVKQRGYDFSAGIVIAACLLGAAEGIYRDVSMLYAASLYGSLALFSIPVGSVLRRILPIKGGLFKWGMSLGLSVGTLGLLGFILFRDVFHEEKSTLLMAGILAAAIAATLGASSWVIGRKLNATLELKGLLARTRLLVHLVVPLSFGILSVTGFEQPSQARPQSSVPEPRTAPAIIMVVADTLRADVMSAWGDAAAELPLAQTPVLERWETNAIVFDDAVTSSSWTRPSVASLLTSLRPTEHGVMSKTSRLSKDFVTLGEWLTQHNVATGAVVTNYNLEPRFGFNQGFDYYDYLAPKRIFGAPEGSLRLAGYNIIRKLILKFRPEVLSPDHFYRSGKMVVDLGMKWIETIPPDQPAFLWLHLMEPHDPYFGYDGSMYARASNPNPDLELSKAFRDAYLDQVEDVDRTLGLLETELKRLEMTPSTTIILTSDHGEEFGEHGGFFHGTTLYEEQLHVPLLFYHPAFRPEHRSDVARLIDLPTTISETLGLGRSPNWKGRHLFGQDQAPDFVWALQDHQGNKLQAIRETSGQSRKLILANPDNPRGLDEQELYHLAVDPLEQTKLQNPESVQTLTETLEALLGGREDGSGSLVQPRNEAPLSDEDRAALEAIGYME